MNIRARLNWRTLVGITLLVVMGSFLSNWLALASPAPLIPSGLRMAPLRSELNIAPGTVYTGHLSISNTTTTPMAVSMDAEEFRVTGSSYNYSFDANSAVAAWVRFVPSMATLAPGQSESVMYTISVPLGTEAGGRYIGLFASTSMASGGTGVNLQERVASLLYITIEGDVTKTGKFVSLNTPWIFSKSAQWALDIQNTGTAHFRSQMSVTLESLTGKKIDTSNSDELILPNTIRLVTGKIPTPAYPGIYKVVYTIGLGDSPGQIIGRYIIYLPPFAVLALSAIVVLIIASIYWPRRFKQKI